MIIPIMVMLLTSLLTSCNPQKADKAGVGNPDRKVISRDQAIGELPCFRCHSFEKFSAKPEKGVFAHQLHITGGFHCNQCHDFQGHRHIVINKDVCGLCHNIKNISLNRTAMPSRFNHDEHSKKFGCKECHPKLFLMKAGSAHITMQELNNGAYCGDCHNGRKAFPASACARCHNTTGGYDKDLVYKVDGMGPVTFSHAFHSSAFSCEKCHPKIFAMKKTQGKMTMESMNNGKHCGACHNGTVATAVTDCAKCHK